MTITIKFPSTMNQLVTLLLLSVSLSSLIAQNSVFETGTVSFNAGSCLGVLTSGYARALPTVKVNAEIGYGSPSSFGVHQTFKK